MRRILILTAALAALTAPSAGAATSCGDYKGVYLEMRATNMSCSLAKRYIIKRRCANSGCSRFVVGSFSCPNSSGGRITCRSGSRSFSWVPKD